MLLNSNELLILSTSKEVQLNIEVLNLRAPKFSQVTLIKRAIFNPINVSLQIADEVISELNLTEHNTFLAQGIFMIIISFCDVLVSSTILTLLACHRTYNFHHLRTPFIQIHYFLYYSIVGGQLEW